MAILVVSMVRCGGDSQMDADIEWTVVLLRVASYYGCADGCHLVTVCIHFAFRYLFAHTPYLLGAEHPYYFKKAFMPTCFVCGAQERGGVKLSACQRCLSIFCKLVRSADQGSALIFVLIMVHFCISTCAFVPLLHFNVLICSTFAF